MGAPVTSSPSEDVVSAIEDLSWLVTIPHTIDQVTGIYAEATQQHRSPMHPFGLTPGQLAERIESRRNDGTPRGKGGHSDPTGDAAVRRAAPGATGDEDELGPTEDNELLSTMSHAVTRIEEGAADLAAICDVTGPHPAPDATVDRTSTGRLGRVTSTLHRLPVHWHQHDGAVWIARTLAEDARWLRGKAEAIWLESKGETKQVAVQRPLRECSHCSKWRTGTIGSGTDGLCDEDRNFKRNHGCMSTEPIVRRWEVGMAATPGQILEAKAHAKAPVKRARCSLS